MMMRSLEPIRFESIDDLVSLLSSVRYKKMLDEIVPEDQVLMTSNGEIYPENYWDKIEGLANQQLKHAIPAFLNKDNQLFSPLQILSADREILNTLKQKRIKNELLYFAQNKRAYNFVQIKAFAEQQEKSFWFQLRDIEGNRFSPLQIISIDERAKNKFFHKKPFESINGPIFFSGAFLGIYWKHLFEQLTQRLVISSAGETYWLKDVLNMTDEEAKEISIRFQNKIGEEFSVVEIKKIANSTSVLIHNKPLAKVFCTINLTSKKIWTWSNEELKCGIYHRPTIFPVITPYEDVYERRAMEEYITHCQREIFPHPSPLFCFQLSKKQIVENHALKDLNWLRFELDNEQRSSEKIFLEKQLNKIYINLTKNSILPEAKFFNMIIEKRNELKKDLKKLSKQEQLLVNKADRYEYLHLTEEQVQKEMIDFLHAELKNKIEQLNLPYPPRYDQLKNQLGLIGTTEIEVVKSKRKELKNQTTALQKKRDVSSIIISGVLCLGIVMLLIGLTPIRALSNLTSLFLLGGGMSTIFLSLAGVFFYRSHSHALLRLEQNITDITSLINLEKERIRNLEHVPLYRQQIKEIELFLKKLTVNEQMSVNHAPASDTNYLHSNDSSVRKAEEVVIEIDSYDHSDVPSAKNLSQSDQLSNRKQDAEAVIIKINAQKPDAPSQSLFKIPGISLFMDVPGSKPPIKKEVEEQEREKIPLLTQQHNSVEFKLT